MELGAFRRRSLFPEGSIQTLDRMLIDEPDKAVEHPLIKL
jgi:hypothetical protein